MKKSLFLRVLLEPGWLITAAWLTTNAAIAANCDEDSISEVSESGEIITMLSGQIYEVLPGDEVDSALWLSAEDVLICQRSIKQQSKTYIFYEIINTDEDGEKIGARRLR